MRMPTHLPGQPRLVGEESERHCFFQQLLRRSDIMNRPARHRHSRMTAFDKSSAASPTIRPVTRECRVSNSVTGAAQDQWKHVLRACRPRAPASIPQT